MRALRCLLALLALLLACAAHAHKPSDSYLSITVDDAGAISGRWDIALRDLDYAIGLDANGDGDITWGEVRARHADIAAYALARFSVKGDDLPCIVTAGTQQIDEHTDGAYSVIPLRIACPHRPLRLNVGYTLFADLDPQHRGLLNLQSAGGARVAVLGPQAPEQRFVLGASDRWSQFVDYAREGVWHIWLGYDHILFLMSLLLPAAMVYRDRTWRAAPTLREPFVDVLKIVSAFTVAHSITLSLATFGVIELPTRVVESAIALSVVLAALNNVFPVTHERRWMVAFCFGLIHGFGFASVLAGLGLPQGALLLALVAFNLGIELGQMCIVGVFLPLLFNLRATFFYRWIVFTGGSLFIAAIAAVWFCERAFGFKVLSF